MWRVLSVLAVAAVALSSAHVLQGASTDPDDCAFPSESLVGELLDWIAAHSAYGLDEARRQPPAVVFCTDGETIPYAGGNVLVEPHERGVYDYQFRTIYLVTPWSPEEPRDVAILLHELVHDVQFANREWECPNATETEAYKLQGAWLNEQGIDPQIDWLKVYFRSKCPWNPHP